MNLVMKFVDLKILKNKKKWWQRMGVCEEFSLFFFFFIKNEVWLANKFEPFGEEFTREKSLFSLNFLAVFFFLCLCFIHNNNNNLIVHIWRKDSGMRFIFILCWAKKWSEFREKTNQESKHIQMQRNEPLQNRYCTKNFQFKKLRAKIHLHTWLLC